MDLQLITAVVASAIAGALLLVWALVQVFNRASNPEVKKHLEALFLLLDTWADNMAIAQKRYEVVAALQALLGWRRIFLPQVIVGLIVDLGVYLIRKVGVPDLHKTDAAPAIAPDPADKEGAL